MQSHFRTYFGFLLQNILSSVKQFHIKENREKDEEMLLFSSYGEWDHRDVKIQKLFIQLLGAKFSYINQMWNSFISDIVRSLSMTWDKGRRCEWSFLISISSITRAFRKSRNKVIRWPNLKSSDYQFVS